MTKPPYTITETAADYLARIVETAAELEYATDFRRDLRLHRVNRLRTIYSSLAVEGNPLSLGEVSAVIAGRLVAGRQADVTEVKNAYEAYDRIMGFDPYRLEDLLEAHRLMTQGLVRESGRFRSGEVGVFNGPVPIHLGARPRFVPQLMAELFGWAKASPLHPVLKSAAVHYEMEIIHPFADGNGRMGRLWQTLILAKWKEIFAWIPMESAVYSHRPQYYEAIAASSAQNDAGPFIEFSLSAILSSLLEQKEAQGKHRDEHRDGPGCELSETQQAVLRALEGGPLSRRELFEAIGLRGDSRAFKRHVEPLISAGLVSMTLPDSPSSKMQKYQLTRQSNT